MSWLIDGLIRIDARVLDAVERFTRKLQILTGKTSFFFADLCLAGICGLIIVRSILYEFDFILLFFLMLCLIKLTFSRLIEEIEIDRLHEGFANPDKTDDKMIVFRLFNLLVSMPSIVELIKNINSDINILSLIIILITAYFYLSACDPLPPCQSKIKEWIKGLFPSEKETALVAVK